MTLDMKSTKNTLYAMVIKESVSVGKFADDSVCVCVFERKFHFHFEESSMGEARVSELCNIMRIN